MKHRLNLLRTKVLLVAMAFQGACTYPEPQNATGVRAPSAPPQAASAERLGYV